MMVKSLHLPTKSPFFSTKVSFTQPLKPVATSGTCKSAVEKGDVTWRRRGSDETDQKNDGEPVNLPYFTFRKRWKCMDSPRIHMVDFPIFHRSNLLGEVPANRRTNPCYRLRLGFPMLKGKNNQLGTILHQPLFSCWTCSFGHCGTRYPPDVLRSYHHGSFTGSRLNSDHAVLSVGPGWEGWLQFGSSAPNGKEHPLQSTPFTISVWGLLDGRLWWLRASRGMLVTPWHCQAIAALRKRKLGPSTCGLQRRTNASICK